MKTESILSGVVLLTCLAATDTSASSAPTAAGWDPDDTLPTVDAVKAAAGRARAERCRTPSCQGIETIDGLIRIVLYVVDNASMSGLPGPLPYSTARIWRRLHQVLFNRPDLYGPFCAASVRLLEKVSPDPDEILVPVTLLADGVDVDLRSHLHCAHDMVAALPKSPAIDQVRINAYDTCTSPYDRHPRPEAACETLVQGLPPARWRN